MGIDLTKREKARIKASCKALVVIINSSHFTLKETKVVRRARTSKQRVLLVWDWALHSDLTASKQ